MNIVIVDPKCRSVYDADVLNNQALGGTEATVVRIAEGLSQQHSVKVIQHIRKIDREENPRLWFLSPAHLIDAVSAADHVIFVQKAQYISKISRNTKARLWLWLHNYLADEVPFYWRDHLRYKLGIICVSKTHAIHTRKHLRSLPVYWGSLGALSRGGLLYHYNPVDAKLRNDPTTKKDRNKLVFFSSPHKGLEHVIQSFQEAYKKNNDLRLFIANPGYMKEGELDGIRSPGIVPLGKLPQHQVLNHVREALCVFYPQRKTAETFGLVYAESNAVGTPVLAHDFGSAKEILARNNPPMDTTQPQAVTDTLLEWSKNGGPSVEANPNFEISKVIQNWNQFLLEPDDFIRKQHNA